MISGQALRNLLEQTIKDFGDQVEAEGRVEYATALVELATLCYCTLGVILTPRDAIILCARMQGDLVALWERGVGDAQQD